VEGNSSNNGGGAGSRRYRKSTIKDVARRAGVSTTTVSVFVSGRESVCSPQTAERIRAAVAALHYTPSSLISAAQTKVTRTVGVCVRSPLDPLILDGNGFFERLWRGITAAADAEDYSLLHYPRSVRDADPGRVEPFLDGRVDGVLFHAHESENTRPGRVARAGMPTVLLTRSQDLPEHCGAAWADEAQAVDLALSHLWELGHRRIAHVAGPVGREDDAPEAGDLRVDDVALLRLHAYEAWVRRRGAFRPEWLAYAGAWHADEVRAAQIVATWRALPWPPTAVLCANDAIAAAVVRATLGAGWSVPGDLSVVGVDNAGAARESAPPLTTVDVALESVASEGFRCLLRLLGGAPLEACRVALPVSKLVVRASTAPPRLSSPSS
jgi:Transcriptional regulators